MGPISNHHYAHRGFTLVELMVVAAIILVITGIVFAGQGNFNNSLVLQSTTYDIALSLRDAETYGLGTRALGGIANAGFGLDFAVGTPHAYTFFADSDPPPGGTDACHPLPANGAGAPNAYPGDCVYSASDGTVAVYQIGNNVSIQSFCSSNDNGATWSCSSDQVNPLTQLDIVFLRPNATPFIAKNGSYDPNASLTNACLQITSAAGNSLYINVYRSGQISIGSSCAASGGGTLPPPPAAPTCTLTVSPSSITTGDSTLLTWTSTNATAAFIDNGIGPVALSGSASETPSDTATYTETVTGAGGTGYCSATVTVTPPTPPPTCVLTATPSSITTGGSSTLSWTTTNASGFTISGVSGSQAVPTGSTSVSPTASTTYTGTVSGAGGTSICSAPVTVSGPTPPVVVYLTSGVSWTVPSDWNSASNTIEAIGGGGAGNALTANGAGGGAYSKISNLSLTSGAHISYSIGAGGYNHDGGDTWFDSAGILLAKGGTTAGAGGAASAGVGAVKYSGGNGGTSAGVSKSGAGGGGGAAGPRGAGAKGGNATSGGGGGGGGGADGGTAGANVTTTTGGKGGNGPGGTGGGAGGTLPSTAGGAGSAGGGGGGGAGNLTSASGSKAGNGGTSADWDSTHGAGAGGGGSSSLGDSFYGGGFGGGYGGGAGGGGGSSTGGIIVITYTPL